MAESNPFTGMRKIPILGGKRLIEDIMNPKAEEIDLEHIELALRRVYRYSAAWGALTIHQHRVMTREIAKFYGVDREVVTWAYHHDDHEGIIGDLVSPLKTVLRSQTDVYDQLTRGLDYAICDARGLPYPTPSIREHVDVFDRVAGAIEWVYGLGNDREAPWIHPEFHNLPDAICSKVFAVAQLAR